MAVSLTRESSSVYEFGAFRLDPSERLLLREGQTVQLAPKVFDTLMALIESRGRLIEKEELMSKLWPDTFVEEATLARNISDLRKALGESTGEQKFIKTVPKRGYRFTAAVKCSRLEEPAVIVERHFRSRMVFEEHLDADAGVVSIAVLPFRPITAEGRDEYLELGIADALITRLSNVSQIVVRPTSSVRKYIGVEQESAQSGRELRVGHVLDGSIQRAGDRIRVTAQLVSVEDGRSLWAGKFDERFTDIFSVEDAISEQVANALVLKLTGEERRLIAKHYMRFATAHHWYAVFLAETGRAEEALAEIKLAQSLDPVSLIIGADVGMILYLARDYDQAVEQCSATLEMDPCYFRARMWAHAGV